VAVPEHDPELPVTVREYDPAASPDRFWLVLEKLPGPVQTKA